ncbi:MAG TPA: ribonuclease P protein component [Tepidisphaeraceae bacterium]|nr:ribonuclease P protein component [Tepidisphaeraceae bacterium]
MAERSYRFPKSHRLRSRVEFSAVFEAKVSDARGPLIMYALPNKLNHPRLGLVVGRRLGTATKRNRIKRLLREAFRLHQYDLPQGYDFVIVVRPHTELILAEYQKLMTALTLRLHHAWEKKKTPMNNERE